MPREPMRSPDCLIAFLTTPPEGREVRQEQLHLRLLQKLLFNANQVQGVDGCPDIDLYSMASIYHPALDITPLVASYGYGFKDLSYSNKIQLIPIFTQYSPFIVKNNSLIS